MGYIDDIDRERRKGNTASLLFEAMVAVSSAPTATSRPKWYTYASLACLLWSVCVSPKRDLIRLDGLIAPSPIRVCLSADALTGSLALRPARRRALDVGLADRRVDTKAKNESASAGVRSAQQDRRAYVILCCRPRVLSANAFLTTRLL